MRKQYDLQHCIPGIIHFAMVGYLMIINYIVIRLEISDTMYVTSQLRIK